MPRRENPGLRAILAAPTMRPSNLYVSRAAAICKASFLGPENHTKTGFVSRCLHSTLLRALPFGESQRSLLCTPCCLLSLSHAYQSCTTKVGRCSYCNPDRQALQSDRRLAILQFAGSLEFSKMRLSSSLMRVLLSTVEIRSQLGISHTRPSGKETADPTTSHAPAQVSNNIGWRPVTPLNCE